MPSMSKEGRVHSGTLTRLSRGELPPAEKRKRKSRKAPKVKNIKPHRLLWGIAIVSSDGDTDRIERVSDNELIIWNHPKPWPRRE